MSMPRTAPLYVTRSVVPDRDILNEMNSRIFESGIYSNFGQVEQSLTGRLSERFGCKNVLLFNNGTIALLTALLALPRKKGTFLTSPFTFPATVHCIKIAGYDVKFVDVDPLTFNIDPAKIEAACDETTIGVLAVHVYGNPCDTKAIGEICSRRDLYEIYDAAHCFDVFEDGKSVYQNGLVSMASLHATKLMHTGEGGALFISDPSLFKDTKSCMNFGIQGEDIVHGVGLNGKMSEVNAAIGMAVLASVGSEISARSGIAAIYQDLLKTQVGVRFPRFREGVTRNFQYFPVVFDPGYGFDRDKIWSDLRARNIFARKYFHPLMSNCYPYSVDENIADVPHALQASMSVLCLPMHSGVSQSDVEEIADVIIASKAN